MPYDGKLLQDPEGQRGSLGKEVSLCVPFLDRTAEGLRREMQKGSPKRKDRETLIKRIPSVMFALPPARLLSQDGQSSRAIFSAPVLGVAEEVVSFLHILPSLLALTIKNAVSVGWKADCQELREL